MWEWLQNEVGPEWQIATYGQPVTCYWLQWKSLHLREDLSTRKWESVEGRTMVKRHNKNITNSLSLFVSENPLMATNLCFYSSCYTEVTDTKCLVTLQQCYWGKKWSSLLTWCLSAHPSPKFFIDKICELRDAHFSPNDVKWFCRPSSVWWVFSFLTWIPWY